MNTHEFFKAENVLGLKKITKTETNALFGAFEAEAIVLGSLLSQSLHQSTIFEILNAGDFSIETHCVIFKNCLKLFENASPINAVTVLKQLRASGDLAKVGGYNGLIELVNTVGSLKTIDEYLKIVKEYSMRNQLFLTCKKTLEAVQDETKDVFQLKDDAQSDILKVGEGLEPTTRSISDIVDMCDLSTTSEYIPTGFIDLDRIIGGWEAGKYVVIGARPSMGKTSLLLNMMMQNVSMETPTAFFSLEMTKMQLYKRLIAYEARTELKSVRHNKEHFKSVSEHLKSYKLYVDDSSTITVNTLKGRIRKLKSEHDVKVVYVDYLGLLDSGLKAGSGSYEENKHISKALKDIAKSLDVCLIVAHQLNREVEKRTNKEPQLSDLRDSGNIEQDAHLVMMLYRPAYYGVDVGSDGMPVEEGYTKILIRKNRSGKTGEVELIFDGSTFRFSNANKNL